MLDKIPLQSQILTPPDLSDVLVQSHDLVCLG